MIWCHVILITEKFQIKQIHWFKFYSLIYKSDLAFPLFFQCVTRWRSCFKVTIVLKLLFFFSFISLFVTISLWLIFKEYGVEKKLKMMFVYFFLFTLPWCWQRLGFLLPVHLFSVEFCFTHFCLLNLSLLSNSKNLYEFLCVCVRVFFCVCVDVCMFVCVRLFVSPDKIYLLVSVFSNIMMRIYLSFK